MSEFHMEQAPDPFKGDWDYIKQHSTANDTEITVEFRVPNQTNPDWTVTTFGIIVGYEETATGRWIDLHVLRQHTENTQQNSTYESLQLQRAVLQAITDKANPGDAEAALFQHASTTYRDIQRMTGDFVDLPILDEFVRYRLEDIGEQCNIIAIAAQDVPY